MRLARLLAAGLAALLVLAVAAAIILPPRLDWGRYRGAIAALASSAIGHPVRIEGAITLTLLPEPVLTAARIGIADTDQHFALTAKALRLRVALWSLLGGRIDARDLTLSGASLRLGWPLRFRPEVALLPPWMAGLTATVEDGRVAIGALSLTGIDATLARDPLTGMLSAAGAGSLYRRSWRFAVHLSPPGRDGSAALELALDGQGVLQGTGGRFSGQMAADGSVAGRVSARGDDLSRVLPAPAIAWQAEGRLSAAAGRAVADQLSLELGGVPATAAVTFRVAPAPRLDLALAVTRLDLDRWLPVLQQGGEVVPTRIDLSAEAATLAGGTLRHLRAAFEVRPDAVGLREATATLPGAADIRLDGRLLRPPGGPAAFDGTLRLAAPDLSATLRWLAGLVRIPRGALPSGVLRRADLSGRLALRGGQATLAGITGTLDGGALRGTLGLRMGARPAISVAASLDRIDLDPWLRGVDPDPARWTGLGDVDLELRLAAGQALWRGASIAPFTLDAGISPGRITLRRAAGTIDGVRARAAFALAEGRLDSAGLDLATDDLAAAIPLVPPSWRLPSGYLPSWHLLSGLMRGPARLAATASGRPNALRLALGVDLGDAHLDAAPTLDLTKATWSGPLTLRHPGAPRLLRLLGLPGAAAWIGDGSLALRADLAGAPNEVSADDIDLTAGVMHLGGQLAVRPGPALSGRIRAERLPIRLPPAHGSEPLPLLEWVAAMAGWKGALGIEAGQVLVGGQPLLQQAKATLVLDGGKARLEDLTATIGAGTMAGSLALDATRDPPLVQADCQVRGLTLGGKLFGLPFDLDAGTLAMSVRLEASGHSPAALLATLSGSAGAELTDGLVSGFDLPGLRRALTEQEPASIEAAALAALAGGRSPVQRLVLAGRLAGGELTLTDAMMRAEAGEARATGTVDLADRLFDLDLALRPGAGAPEIGLLVAGPFAAPKLVPEFAGLAGWLAQRPEGGP